MPCCGPDSRGILDLGLDTLLDHLKHDVVQDPAFPVERSDSRQIAATAVTGRDGERFLDGDLLQIGAGLVVGLGCAVARLGPLRGGVRVQLRGRDAGVAAVLAGCLFEQDRQQQCQQGHQDPEHGIGFRRHFAALAQSLDLIFGGLQFLAQELVVHRWHHSASTAIRAASTARRSPGSIAA